MQATMDFIVPQWDVPARVRALVTTRSGGVSGAPYASLNLGDHVGDDPACVAHNRARLRAGVPAEPRWLQQVHGIKVCDADATDDSVEADAALARRPATVCAILTADCLPVLLADRHGTVVAAAHAGWRGLAAGVLEATVRRMDTDGADIRAWLGPAIGPQAFEVGAEVRAAFLAVDPGASVAFKPSASGRWLADIYVLARRRLASVGVAAVSGGGWCTVSDAQRFYSYRRDGVTGRMASLIWLAD